VNLSPIGIKTASLAHLLVKKQRADRFGTSLTTKYIKMKKPVANITPFGLSQPELTKSL